MNKYQLAIVAIEAATRLLTAAMKAREEASRTREWTPEEEAEFDRLLAESKTKPSWQIDPD